MPRYRLGEYQDTGWRSFFVDSRVKALIGEALVNNRDLRMAVLKVQEARAQYGVTDADRYPQLTAGSSGTYSGKLKVIAAPNVNSKLDSILVSTRISLGG